MAKNIEQNSKVPSRRSSVSDLIEKFEQKKGYKQKQIGYSEN